MIDIKEPNPTIELSYIRDQFYIQKRYTVLISILSFILGMVVTYFGRFIYNELSKPHKQLKLEVYNLYLQDESHKVIKEIVDGYSQTDACGLLCKLISNQTYLASLVSKDNTDWVKEVLDGLSVTQLTNIKKMFSQ